MSHEVLDEVALGFLGEASVVKVISSGRFRPTGEESIVVLAYAVPDGVKDGTHQPLR